MNTDKKPIAEHIALIRIWISHGWNVYRKNYTVIIIITALALLISFAASITLKPYGLWPGRIWRTLVGTHISVGFFYYRLKLVRHQVARPNDLLEGFRCYLTLLATAILYYLITFAGLLLIIPAIVWYIKYGFSISIAVDKKMSPIQSLKYSDRITYGYKMTLFIFAILIIPLIPLIILQMSFFKAIYYGTLNLTEPLAICQLALFIVNLILILPVTQTIGTAIYDYLLEQYAAGIDE